MSATDAVRRLLVLVPWLLERPGAHVDEAASAVGVDRATVLEDLSLLDFCGLPGRLGGDLFETQLVGDRILLQLAPAFERPLRPTPDEALRLVLSLDTVASAMGEELPGLDDAVARLRELAGIPADVRVADDATSDHLAALRAALQQSTSVVLTYRGRADDDARDRVVDPWELVLHEGQWYLQGHDHEAGDRRTFRLDRIEQATTTTTPITVPRPPGELPTPRYTPGPEDLEVELLVRPEGAWVLDVLTPGAVRRGDDGVTRALVATDAPSWVQQVVLAAGGHVTVLGPPSVRTAVLEAARRGLAGYAETGVED